MSSIDRDPDVEAARQRARDRATDDLARMLASLGFRTDLLDPARRDRLTPDNLARLAGDVAHWRRAVELAERAAAQLAHDYGASWALIGAAVLDDKGNPMPRQNTARKYAAPKEKP